MKQLKFFVSLLLMCVSLNAFAQDAAPVMYIPGMPVPPAAAAPSSAASSDTAQGGGDAAARLNAARISRVTKAGEMNHKPDQAAAPAQEDPARAEYKGVTPPKRLVPENANTFNKSSANQVSWIGFMPEDNQHRIFIQTSQPSAYEQIATASNRIELKIVGAKLAVSNNQRELDMTYFKTPFKNAKAVRSGKDTRIIIQLKQPVPYEIKQHDNMLEIFVSPSAQ